MMTYYSQQVHRLKALLYPDDDLCRQVIAAKEYIDNHFSEAIDLKKTAVCAHYSRYHFLRLFKSLYGTTPHRYLTSLRIQKAKQLLENGDCSTTGVCQAVGFESVNSFRELFKRYTGQSPATYSRLYLNKKIENSNFRVG